MFNVASRGAGNRASGSLRAHARNAQNAGSQSSLAALTSPVGQPDPEEPAGPPTGTAPDAPTGFDNATNGATAQATFDSNREKFEEVETIADGLGPTYNAQSCRECHQNVVTGGASQLPELRSGRTAKGQFFASQGGTLIEARATNPDIMAFVGPQDNTQTLRISTNTLGSGFVECIANAALLRIRDAQSAGQKGLADIVPVLEANGAACIGRFGWKSQHAPAVKRPHGPALHMGLPATCRARHGADQCACTRRGTSDPQ